MPTKELSAGTVGVARRSRSDDHVAPLPSEQDVRAYLATRFDGDVELVKLSRLGESDAHDVKSYGYGIPLKVEYELNGHARTAVLETVAPGPFGHEHMSDRAQSLLWSHTAFNALPRHVRSLDVGGFRRDGRLASLGDIREFFILNEYVTGEGYFRDLERLRDGAALDDRDLRRADALCDYLVEIHAVPGPHPALYLRRIRELVGHHECIMGMLDSFGDGAEGVTAAELKAVEHACVEWRWRLRGFSHRLRQVHGDFHPWNLLFAEGARFVALDRSRGEWGEPADDVACLTINYLFFSLLRSGRLEGAFATLFSRFWRRYLAATSDDELCAVVAPFFAFRGLVLASPVWYPRLPPTIRRTLMTFVHAVLAAPAFDPDRVNDYLR